MKSAFTAAPVQCDNLRMRHPLVRILALIKGRNDPLPSSSLQVAARPDKGRLEVRTLRNNGNSQALVAEGKKFDDKRVDVAICGSLRRSIESDASPKESEKLRTCGGRADHSKSCA